MSSSLASKTSLRELVLFGIGGTLGFAVDACVLLLVHRFTSMDLYVARCISFLCAATFTWAYNRTFTFRSRDGRMLRQWAQFLLVNLVGGGANLGTYMVLLSAVEFVADNPVAGVAAGSLAGLLFNFVLSKTIVFSTVS